MSSRDLRQSQERPSKLVFQLSQIVETLRRCLSSCVLQSCHIDGPTTPPQRSRSIWPGRPEVIAGTVTYDAAMQQLLLFVVQPSGALLNIADCEDLTRASIMHGYWRFGSSRVESLDRR